MSNTSQGKIVLILGGLTGLSRELALRYALEGDTPVLVALEAGDDSGFAAAFQARSLKVPMVLRPEAGACDPQVLEALKARFARVDVVILARWEAMPVSGLDAYQEKALLDSVEQNTWPLIHYTRQLQAELGAYPKYVLGVAPAQLDQYLEGLDYVAATQSLNEVFVKYLNYHLHAKDIIFNMLRVEPAGALGEVAKTVFAMTSGLLDALRGQTVVVDGGGRFRPQA